MATTTEHYSLVKLDLNDTADITQFSQNMDIIDEELYKASINEIKLWDTEERDINWYSFFSQQMNGMPVDSSKLLRVHMYVPDKDLGNGTWLMLINKIVGDVYTVQAVHSSTADIATGAFYQNSGMWKVNKSIEYSVEDLTVGESALATGKLYFVYE